MGKGRVLRIWTHSKSAKAGPLVMTLDPPRKRIRNELSYLEKQVE